MIFRFFGNWLILFAIVALIFDVTQTMQGAPFAPRSSAAHLQVIAPGMIEALATLVRTSLHPMLWEYGLAPVLALPAFVLLGSLGLACVWLGRRRKGINIYAN